MVLKLQYSCSLLNTLLRHNYEDLYIGLNSRAFQKKLHCRVQRKSINSDFNKLYNSMDRFVERHKKESFKNIVLTHEEIFKQQVQELHRLYVVQKKLMSELRGKELKLSNTYLATSKTPVITDSKTRFRNSTSTSETRYCSHASAQNQSTDVPNSEQTSMHRFSICKNSRDLSYCLRKPWRISKEYNFNQAVEGESHESCSNLDLTLSIGCAADMNKKTVWKQMANDSSLLLSSNLNRADSIQEYTNSSGGFGSESLKRPNWLFQALNLNRT